MKTEGSTYTVFLSWRISLEENSLRTSRKARLIGGNSGPRGFWYLNANSIPSLKHDTEGKKLFNSLEPQMKGF